MKTLVIALTVLFASSAYAGKLKNLSDFTPQQIQRTAKYDMDFTQKIVFNEADFGYHEILPWNVCTDGEFLYGPDVTLEYNCASDDNGPCTTETVELVQPIEGTRMKCFKRVQSSDGNDGKCVDGFLKQVALNQPINMKLNVLDGLEHIDDDSSQKPDVVGYTNYTINTCPDAKAN